MDFYATLFRICRKNRYSVGIYTPKGAGEGEKPGLTVGTAAGDRVWVWVPRNLDPHVNTHCLVGEL